MSAHPSHHMHDDSLREFRRLEQLQGRKAVIRRLFERARRPVTDLEVMDQLLKWGLISTPDPNQVRPSISTMLGEGVLVELKTKRPCRHLMRRGKDKKVRQCWLASRLPEIAPVEVKSCLTTSKCSAAS